MWVGRPHKHRWVSAHAMLYVARVWLLLPLKHESYPKHLQCGVRMQGSGEQMGLKMRKNV